MMEALVRRLGGTEDTIGRFLIACMAIGFISVVVAGIAAAWQTQRSEQFSRAVAHTYQVEREIADARLLIEQAETPRLGYLITRSPAMRSRYRAAVDALPATLQRIATSTADNPRQQRNLAALRTLVDALEAARNVGNQLVDAGRRSEATQRFFAGRPAQIGGAIRRLSDAMTQEEERLLKIRDDAQRASLAGFYVTLGAAGILLLFVAIVSLTAMLRYTRDLAASHDAIRDFADSLEEQVGERTADLSRANAEIHRFAYIVSHDLRSPLVNVMGFTAELEAATATIAELIDRAEAIAPAMVTGEVRVAVREDLPEAIGFIRTSTEKMDRLINAILTLSRQGRRVLAPVPIDTAALVASVGATLRHQLDRAGAVLEIGDLPPITSDRLALEQIFSNLIENAIKYLKSGRPGRITVRGGSAANRLWYDVADNGRGIDPRDHQRVFDLFRRSGKQDQAGEGIGLAHVRSLANRLGGIIDVTSALDSGSTFRLTLPPILKDDRPDNDGSNQDRTPE